MILQEKAFAKINLTLDVLDTRPDGYHNIRSIMQTVGLYDVITAEIGTGQGWSLSCNVPGIPCDERNLVWKAAKCFCEAAGADPQGLTMTIEKHIPSGAGMGGGSADAAAILRLLNRHFGEPMTLDALAELGAKVGSDVPFCVVGGTVLCEGRGEILTPLAPMPKCVILGCQPEFSISTPVLYRKLDEAGITDRPDSGAMEDAIARGDVDAIARNIRNVFEPVAAAEYSQIGHIKEVCAGFGALAVQMTGSGSVVFAIMPDQDAAGKAAQVLKERYPTVFVTEPV